MYICLQILKYKTLSMHEHLNVWTQILQESQSRIQLLQITLHFSIKYFTSD